MKEEKEAIKNEKSKSYFSILKKIGIVGFILFLIKGLLWLFIPYLIFK